MTKISVLHEEFMKNPKYREEYAKADAEFSILETLLEARAKAHMSQEDVALKLKTTQSAIARLEGGKVSPSIATLRRYAEAVGAKLKIQFISNDAKA